MRSKPAGSADLPFDAPFVPSSGPAAPSSDRKAPSSRLADEDAREQALDAGRSFIVQAPAGSGKTELLIHRYLELLARVDEPDQIIAITFTRAATAEMRNRVLRALEQARDAELPAQETASRLILTARAVLANDKRRGWKLLELPQRLNIQTIDSLCLSIAQQTPLLSRLGGSLTPVEDAAPLYAAAARRTLACLGGRDSELNLAIAALLELRETSLSDCEGLIAGMLAQRDQWGRALPLSESPDWPLVRQALQAPFVEERRQVLAQAQALFAKDEAMAREIFELLRYACENLRGSASASPVLALKEISCPEEMTDHSHWEGLCQFFLTKNGKCRAGVNVNLGFPAAGNGSRSTERQQWKDRFTKLVTDLSTKPELLDQLCRMRKLPPADYSEEQWQMLRHVRLILRRAIAELRVIFAERNQVDFVELGLAAAQVLRNETDRLPADLAARWPHLLVDEFQDTSRAQYDLFSLLVEAREQPGTCFFVGDPMQSIYGFRQAEVELFEGVRRHGMGEGTHRFPLAPLELRMNFRSHAGLVEPLNAIFREVFAAGRPPEGYSVDFAPSVASNSAPNVSRVAGTVIEAPALHVMAQFVGSGARPEEVLAAQHAEADQAVKIICKHWPQVEAAAQAGGVFRIAVLARAKNHLWLIAEKLREAGIPYRAVEIETLGERQEVLDAASLTRALAHPMDRIAWLSVLRAPWCGLTLQDLHILCGSDDRALDSQPMLQLLRMRAGLLSEDGKQRADRALIALEGALAGQHSQMSFAEWAERTWMTLGGRACVSRAGSENVRAFFRMLDQGGLEELDRNLARLFAAPDPAASERHGAQLMTIHKAKGLEFDVVLIPGLHKTAKRGSPPLLTWLERTTLEGKEESERREFLAAPIGRRHAGNDPLYRWIQKQKQDREEQEAKRLLYVACTRASKELYLFGTATVSFDATGAETLKAAGHASLLQTAWPGVKNLFRAEYEKQKESPTSCVPGRRTPAAEHLEPGGSARRADAVQKLRRLPADWRYSAERDWRHTTEQDSAGGAPIFPGEHSADPTPPDPFAFERPAGSREARALGEVVHALLEELARSAATAEGLVGRVDQIGRWRPRALAMLRQAGLSRARAEQQSAKVVLALKSALEDPVGYWILSARDEAETETSWSAWQQEQPEFEALATRRADRIFRAGALPESREQTHLWIVDYKTAQHGSAGLEAFLDGEKRRYQPQLELYGKMLREAGGEALPLRLALYYPLLRQLLWWEG